MYSSKHNICNICYPIKLVQLSINIELYIVNAGTFWRKNASNILPEIPTGLEKLTMEELIESR